jgi:hypothetical protein
MQEEFFLCIPTDKGGAARGLSFTLNKLECFKQADQRL